MTSSPNLDCDVLIIGGGPAGLAVGIACARNGLNTLICEKSSYPIDKACGEGIMPSGVASLYRLGIADHLHRDDYFPFQGIRYFSAKSHIAEAAFREGMGWGIRRKVLSSAMAAEARSYPGLRLISNTKIERIFYEENQILVQGGDTCFRSNLVIGADGIHSAVRNWIGQARPGRKRFRYGLRRHFSAKPWSVFVEVYWGNGIEAYVTPVGPHSVNLAFLWDRHIAGPMKSKDHIFEHCLDQFPHLGKRLAGALPTDSLTAVGPLEQRVSNTIADGVAMIGDSAGYMDAITGEGISLALGSALLFEKQVIPLMQSHPKKIVSTTDLQPFQRMQAGLFHQYASLADLALFFAGKPWLAGLAIDLLAARPELFQYLLSCNLGTEKMWPGIVPAALGINPRKKSAEIYPA
jgi:menaquinone-9 beta-reductase